MALILKDRVRETSTTTGTGEMTLLGAVTGFITFSSVMATSDTTYYAIVGRGSTEWEVGIGTFNGAGHLTRDTVLSSSNSNALVTFSAGVKDVFIDLPAAKLPGFISAGTQTASTGSVIFSNSNGVTFGMSNNSVITASVAPQVISFFGLGNTTQNSSSALDARSISFNGLGMITVGFSNGSIQLSATQSNQSISYFALGNTTQNSSTVRDARSVSFNGLGIVTVGFSNGSIQLSATQSADSVGLFGLGNTTQNSSTTRDIRSLSFNGLGMITVGFSNGSIQLSATQTNQVVSFFGLGNTTQNSSSAIDARSVSFNGLGALTVGFSNNSIQLSVPTQTNQTVGFYALGNTTQNSSTTFDARTISLNGLGMITVGYSNGSVQISATQSVDTLGIYAASNTTGAQSSSTYDARSLSIAGAGFVSVGHTNGSVIISVTTLISSAQTNQSMGFYAVGNTTQNSSTTFDARTVSFNGLGGATIGYSNGSVQVSVPAITSYSSYEAVPMIGSASTMLSGNTNTSGAASFFPIIVDRYVVAGWVNLVQSMNFTTLGTSSGRQSVTVNFALYSRGTGTNSSTLGSMTSASYSMAVTGNNSTYTFAYPNSTDSAGYTSTTTSSAGVNQTSAFTGGKLVQFPINSTLSPGMYWVGIFCRASTSSVNVGMLYSFGAAPLAASIFGQMAPIGSFSSAYSTGTAALIGQGGNWRMGLASFTSAAQTNLPASVAFSAMTHNLSAIPYMLFMTTT